MYRKTGSSVVLCVHPLAFDRITVDATYRIKFGQDFHPMCNESRYHTYASDKSRSGTQPHNELTVRRSHTHEP